MNKFIKDLNALGHVVKSAFYSRKEISADFTGMDEEVNCFNLVVRDESVLLMNNMDFAAVIAQQNLWGINYTFVYNYKFANLSDNARRFILSHEIGHIKLGHLFAVENIKTEREAVAETGRVHWTELEADEFAAKQIGYKNALEALKELKAAATLYSQEEIAKRIESLEEIINNKELVDEFKVERGEIEMKSKELMILGAATMAKNKEETTMKNYKELQTQALVIKNKVEASDIYFMGPEGKVTDVPILEGMNGATENSVPIFQLHPSMWQVQMAGLQDFHNPAYLSQEQIKTALPFIVDNTESSYAKTLLGKDVPIIEGRNGITLDLKGYSTPLAYGSYNIVFPGQEIDDLDELIRFVPGYAGPGQKRDGLHGFIPEGASHKEYVENLGLELSSFTKNKGDKFIFNLKKIGTRVNLSASAGSLVPMFDGFTYFRTEHKTYNFLNYLIESTIYVLSNGKEEIKLEVIPEDFTVELFEELYGPMFEGEDVEFGNFKAKLKKVATDGTVYFDPALAVRGGLTNSFTFRFAQLAKGLGQVVPQLKGRLGVDAVFFGGAVKGDIAPYIERNQLDFSVLIHARTKDSKLLSFSRQVAKRALSKEVFGQYHALTDSIIQGVIRLDMEYVQQFLSIGKGIDEEEFEDMSQADIQVVHLYQENPKTFLQDVVLRNRLRLFLKKQLEQYINGERIIIDNSVWRHMVSDPYAVMKQLQKGNMSATPDELTTGVARIHSFTVVNGKIDTRKAVLYRFPFLHKYEARKVNTDNKVFMDKESKNYYNQYAEFFTGMQVYSLLDMQAEGQSGADFDGDTTIVIFAQDIAESTGEYPLFLDYSLVDGEVVEGAPFEDVAPVDWSFLTDKDHRILKGNGLSLQDNGDMLWSGKTISNNAQEVIWKAIAYLSMQSLSKGYVGLLSNASDTVVEYATMTRGDKFEAANKLNAFLTIAVRWEIDKTKHGGAFYEQLPFLKMIVAGTNPVAIKKAERRFGIVLRPFFATKQGVERFCISRTMYYGKVAPKKSLWLNSFEHKMIRKHIQNAQGVQEVVDAETSHQYHLVGQAKSLIAKGKREGVITDAMVTAWDWKTVLSSNVSLSHPVKFLQAIRKEMNVYLNMKDEENMTLSELAEIDKKIAQIRKIGMEISDSIDFTIPGEYVFALTYLSIAKNQYMKGRNSDNFKMSYLSDLFSFFGKQALEFLSATKDVQVTLHQGTASFVVIGIDTVDTNLLIVNGRVSSGGFVALEDILNKEIEGLFVVHSQQETQRGVVVKGVFVSSPEEAKVLLTGPSAEPETNESDGRLLAELSYMEED